MPKHYHITQLLQNFHWLLPVQERIYIKYNIVLIAFKALNGLAPLYVRVRSCLRLWSFPGDHERASFYRRHVKTRPMLPTYPSTLDAIITPPISLCISQPFLRNVVAQCRMWNWCRPLYKESHTTWTWMGLYLLMDPI